MHAFSLGRGNLIVTPSGNWNLFRIDFKCLISKKQDSERAWKRIEDEGIFEKEKGFEDDEGFDIIILKSLLKDSPLDNKPVSNSLDLTLLSLYSMESSLDDGRLENDEAKGKGQSKQA